jgi:hypothetical protein
MGLMMPRRFLKNHLLPIVGYALLTIVLTYPTAFRLTTHIPGKGDAPWFLWDLWWFKHALVDLHQSPLHTNLIYYPLTDVPVSWQTPINEFFTIPLQTLTGVVLLYNLLFLSTFVLSGYFMYLLVADVVRRRDLAFVGGLIFAFCSYRGVRGLGHLSLLTTQWMPLSLLLLIRCYRRPTVQTGVAAGVGVALVALSSPYYVAYFLLPVGMVASLYVLLWRRTVLRLRLFWLAALSAVLVAGALCIPFYNSYLQLDSQTQAVLKAGQQHVDEYSADLMSYVLPPGEHPFWGRYTVEFYNHFTTSNEAETTVFFGFLSPLLAIASIFPRWRGRRQVIFWQILALLAFLLSLGPVLHIFGRPIFEGMPYRGFMVLPYSEAFRIPSRIGITAALAAIVLAMMVLKRWMESHPLWRWRPLLVTWSALLLFNMTFNFPFRSADARVPEAFRQIADTPGDFAVLELPAGEMFAEWMSWYMYYQTFHHKRLVSGYLGIRPPRLHAQERGMPFVKRFFTGDPRRLVALPEEQSVPSDGWSEDIRNANELLYQQGIRYVVLHCGRGFETDFRPDFCTSAIKLLNQSLGLPVSRDEGILLYSVTAPK